VTDGRTDRRTNGQTEFSSLYRVCITCSAVKIEHVPQSFGQSYTVPILTSGCNAYGKTSTVDDYRGVLISPVISKVLEYCILDRYGTFLGSSDNRFGFKTSIGCAHAVHVLRSCHLALL